jgi:pimeloyl-ACP methyl ester carboxylesterase
MPTVQVNGAELYYEIHGSGFPLVLSHTGMTSLNNYDQNIPVLAEKYQVIAYDRRGCGRSTAPEGTKSAETWVQDLHGLLQHLGIGRAYIGGVSFGAMLSVEFLFAHPEMVEALISSCGNPFGWGHDRPNPIPFPDRRAQLPGVQTPVLWIYGEEDAGFPPSMGEDAQRLTPGSELVVVQGVGHSPQVDAPQVFNQAIVDFLAKVDARRVAAR